MAHITVLVDGAPLRRDLDFRRFLRGFILLELEHVWTRFLRWFLPLPEPYVQLFLAVWTTGYEQIVSWHEVNGHDGVGVALPIYLWSLYSHQNQSNKY